MVFQGSAKKFYDDTLIETDLHFTIDLHPDADLDLLEQAATVIAHCHLEHEAFCILDEDDL